jgi:phosphomannomutase/phosphoglucomutase
MKIDKTIFRAYDIRGVYGQNLTEEVMDKIGRALGTYMHKNNLGSKVVLGRDVRISSKPLSKAFISGVISAGIDVLDTGTTSFGVTLFTGWKTENSVTAYITASHNPPEWNGIKFYDGGCVGFFEHQNKEIGEIAVKGNFIEGDGSVEKAGMKKEYVNYLKNCFSLERHLKVVVDCGNGSTSFVAPDMFESLGMEVVRLFCEPDPEFSGRGPDVEEENLKQLIEEVQDERADFGVAFDGDGDRLRMVDEKGRIIGADRLAVLIAKNMVKPGETVICNVENSMVFERELGPIGARIIRIPVGHTFMMQEARKREAVLGAESAHHFVIPQYFPFDDAVIPPLKVAELMSKTGKPLSYFVEGIKVYPKKRVNIECADDIKFKVIASLKKKLLNVYKDVNLLDGIRINLSTGWVLIRVSNTSPTIRLTVEALDEKELEEMVERFRSVIEDIVLRRER